MGDENVRFQGTLFNLIRIYSCYMTYIACVIMITLLSTRSTTAGQTPAEKNADEDLNKNIELQLKYEEWLRLVSDRSDFYSDELHIRKNHTVINRNILNINETRQILHLHKHQGRPSHKYHSMTRNLDHHYFSNVYNYDENTDILNGPVYSRESKFKRSKDDPEVSRKQSHNEVHKLPNVVPTPKQELRPSAQTHTERPERPLAAMTSALMHPDESIRISIHPSVITVALEDTSVVVTLNCSVRRHSSKAVTMSESQLSIRVCSQQLRVLKPYYLSPHNRSSIPTDLTALTKEINFNLNCSNPPAFFGVYAYSLGRSSVHIEFLRHVRGTDEPRRLYWKQLDISVVRTVRWEDIAFDCTIPGLMLLVCFSVGCVMDIKELRVYVKSPTPVVIGVVCQFVILPLLTVGAAKLLLKEPDLGLGVLAVWVTPGAGGGHLMIAVAGGDLPLSALLNFTAITLTIIFAPLWLMGPGYVLRSEYTSINLPQLILWISLSVAAFFLGIMLRKLSSTVADAILNWLAKPTLLFAAIIYITLGIFTNEFMFMVLNRISLLLLLALPSLCYCVAFAVSLLLQQTQVHCKTIASHCAVPNCLLAIIMARFSFNQPAGDIASLAPLLSLIFTYSPFLLELLLKVTRTFLKERFATKDEERERLEGSSCSSRLNVTASLAPGTTAMESSSHTSVLTQVTEGYRSASTTTVQQHVTAV